MKQKRKNRINKRNSTEIIMYVKNNDIMRRIADRRLTKQ